MMSLVAASAVMLHNYYTVLHFMSWFFLGISQTSTSLFIWQPQSQTKEHVYEMHVSEIHAHEMHAHEMHVYKTPTHKMHARGMHACAV
jgi:hypothetical protein